MASQHQRNVGPMQAAARCGAKTRSGTPCEAPMIRGGKRCRMHGGKGSGAPRNNRNAYKTGVHTAVMRARGRAVRDNARQAKILIAEIEADVRLARLASATGRNNVGSSVSPPAGSSPAALGGYAQAHAASSDGPAQPPQGEIADRDPRPSTAPPGSRPASPAANLDPESDRQTVRDACPIARRGAATPTRPRPFLGSSGKAIWRAISLTRQDM